MLRPLITSIPVSLHTTCFHSYTSSSVGTICRMIIRHSLIKLRLPGAQMAHRADAVYMFTQHLSLLSCLFAFLCVFDFLVKAAALLRFTAPDAAGSIRRGRGPIPTSAPGAAQTPLPPTACSPRTASPRPRRWRRAARYHWR